MVTITSAASGGRQKPIPPPPPLVVVVVVGGIVVGGAVAGGAVAGGAEGGGAVARDAAGVFELAGGAVPAGAVGVLAWAGTVVVGLDGAMGDEGLVVDGAVADDDSGRVDRVVGVFAPEEAQAARARPPATMIASDRTMRVIGILLPSGPRPDRSRSALRSEVNTVRSPIRSGEST